MPRCIAFLSDYGHRDPCVGMCHAVIRQIDPEIPVIDLTHGIPPQDVRAGAIALADSVPYLPHRSVVLAVVDPGVGGARRAVAVHCHNGTSFVGPDNGLLAPAIAISGGADTMHELTSSQWRLQPVSRTFHGRDLFAPVAARLAHGASMTIAGQPIDPATLVAVQLPQPQIGPGQIVAEVIDIDIYGNIRLAAAAVDLPRSGLQPGSPVEVETPGLRMPARLVGTFDEVGPNEPLVYEDSNGSLAVAVNGGNAATQLNVKRGTQIRITGEPAAAEAPVEPSQQPPAPQP
ncbi:MAG: SAM-dependent chlorinase/fluorinase [Actinobacteria bacterium]|nr:SAM-dependent chlorinase/fluorinase [Actinomycetota bacterium]